MIDQAVNDAMTASAETNTATTQATSDGTVTSDEIYSALISINTAEAEIEYAEQLMGYYSDLYGEYASDALNTMEAMESDLNAISQDLNQIAGVMEQGAEAATAALDQLNQAAAQLQAKATAAQTKAQGWSEQVQSGIQDRTQQALSTAPTDIATDRAGAIKQVYSYVDSIKQAMTDKKVSPDELSQISQLGANAKASLQSRGGPELQSLGGDIDGLTTQLATGDWPGARANVGSFEGSLPSRPSRP